MRTTVLVLSKELKVMFRDRRTIAGVVLVSLVAMPALIGFVGHRDRLLGGARRPVHLLARVPEAPELAVLAGREDLALHRDRAAAEAAGEPYLILEREGRTYRLLADGTERRLVAAARELGELLEGERRRRFEAALAERGIQAAQLQPFGVEVVEIGGPGAAARRTLAGLIPYLVVVLLVGNAIRALHVAVGEKERNTLAALLVSTAPRRSIVLGKGLAITLFALLASGLLVLGLVLFAHLGFTVVSVPEGGGLTLSGRQVAEIAVNVVGLALFVAGIILLVGTFARSQREAGIYTSPLLFVAIFLAVVSLGSAELGTGAYAVPILGNSLAMRETLLGAAELPHLLLPLAGDVALFALLVAGAVALYHREELLFRP